MKRFLCASFAAVALGLTSSVVVAAPLPLTESGQSPFVDLVAQAAPAVVNIDVEQTVTRTVGGAPFDDPFFKSFFGDLFREYQQQIPMKGVGSGFVVSSEGTILTNNHVVEGADKITVTFHDGTKREAKLLGSDPTYDLAVLKVEGKDLPTLKLGDSDSLPVGSWVLAMGNPLGLGVEPTVTVGVLSARDRTINVEGGSYDGFLQTDAAINPGNSGGPLFDINGNVVGINTAIAPMAQGIGFAVPINQAKAVMDDLVEHGSVKRGQLGVIIQDLTSDLAKSLNLKVTEGALVSDVVKESAADKAGVKRGDVILSVDGKTVKKSIDLQNAVRSHRQGDEVELKVNREGAELTLKAKLVQLSEEGAVVESKDASRGPVKALGITVAPREGKEGLQIIEVNRGERGARFGLRGGDVILSVNNKAVTSAGDLQRLLKEGGRVALLLERDGRAAYLLVDLK